MGSLRSLVNLKGKPRLDPDPTALPLSRKGPHLGHPTVVVGEGGWELPYCSVEPQRGIVFIYSKFMASTMTSLAATLSYDDRKPSGLYIVTDSSVTWNRDPHRRWDACQKTFASQTTPDIFGYVGDALFASTIIRQVVEQFNIQLISENDNTSEERHEKFKKLLEIALDKRQGSDFDGATIFHGSRDGEYMDSQFRLWKTWLPKSVNHIYDNEIEIDKNHSYIVYRDGSGANQIQNADLQWKGTYAEQTSRSAMWSFFDALDSRVDKFSGGAPQLVGIWRKGCARNFGLWWHGKRYISGMEVLDGSSFKNIDWFNNLFERCNEIDGQLLKGAKPQPKP